MSNNEKIKLTDFDDKNPEIYKSWFEAAELVNSKNKLKEFTNRIMNDYEHCYDSYPYAVTAIAIASVYCYGGSLSGFQASVIALMFPRYFYFSHVKTGISVRNWDNMLFPQYDYRFEKRIPRDIWESMRNTAKEYLAGDLDGVHRDVIEHWQSIANGEVPFGYEVVDD